MLKQVAFVPLSAAQALVVLVAGDGAVENRVIDIPPGLPPSALVEAGNYISHMLGGLTLAEAQARVRREIEAERIAIDRAAPDRVSSGLAIWSSDGADRPGLTVRGQANLLDDSPPGDPDRVLQLLDDLETNIVTPPLLALARDGHETRIFI